MKRLILICLTLISFNLFAKEIKVIIPYSAGGPTDRVTRIVIKHLTNDQYKFIPEYKLGAGGTIAANYIASIKNDTVLMITSNALITSPILSSVSYDLEKDFTLVDYLGTEPLFLTVKFNSNIKSFKDFLDEGATRTMPYGSAGIGTSGHIGSVIVSQNNKNYLHVPYKGSAGIIIDLLNDQLKWILDSEINIGSFLSDNKVRPIAVLSKNRVQEYPSVPTLKEVGIDDKSFYRWHILIANKNADQDILKYVTNKLNSASLRADLEKIGIDTLDKPNLKNFLSNEYNATKKLIKELNLQ